MSDQPKVFSLVPQEHKGQLSSRKYRATGDRRDAPFILRDIFIQDGVWVTRHGDFKLPSGNNTRLPGLSSDGEVVASHIYNAVDTSSSTSVPVSVPLYAVIDGGGDAILYRADTPGIVTVNGVNFRTSAVHDFWFLNIKNRCFVACRARDTNVVPVVIQRFPTQISHQWGVNRPIVTLGYTALLDVTNADLGIYFETGGANVTNGSASVTRASGGLWDDTGAWDGKFVMLDGIEYQISAVTTDSAMTLTTNYTGATAAVNIKVFYGSLAWTDTGPQYAFAYYNSNTGHISSISPVLQVSEQSIPGVNIELTGIPVTDDDIYNRIVIFRTARDGGILLPLNLDSGHAGTADIIDGMIDNTDAAGPYTYIDELADSELGRVLGVFPGPIDNNPPPADIKYMEYWDGRVWLTTVSRPFLVQFSGSSSQIPLGVPEESFPATNLLPIPSDDGFITGFKAVGNGLTVYTERYVYSVEGNYEGNYRLVRISSRGAGVNQHAVDAHPGDSSNESASVVYLSRDKRLWRQFPGGRIDDIGWPIQDVLDLIDPNTPRPCTIRVCQLRKKWFIALLLQLSASRIMYLYDVDMDSWHNVSVESSLADGGGADSIGRALNAGIYYAGVESGTPVLWMGTTESNIMSICGDSVSIDALYPRIVTHALDMGDPANLKVLHEVVVYAKSGTWTAPTFFVHYDATNYLAGAGTALTYVGAGTPREIDTFAYRFVPRSDTLKKFWYSVGLNLFFPGGGDATPVAVERIDLVYSIASTDLPGRP